MAHDRADAHYGGDFPTDLPPEAGATHIGMFLAWAILRGLESESHQRESAEALDALRQHRMTGREFLITLCDEKFWEQDLSEIGNAFTRDYYVAVREPCYLTDYAGCLAVGLPSVYHVADTWENFARLAPILDRRFAEWKERREENAKSWWGRLARRLTR